MKLPAQGTYPKSQRRSHRSENVRQRDKISDYQFGAQELENGG